MLPPLAEWHVLYTRYLCRIVDCLVNEESCTDMELTDAISVIEWREEVLAASELGALEAQAWATEAILQHWVVKGSK